MDRINAVNTWIKYAENKDYKSLMIDTFEKIYSPRKLRCYRLIYPLITRIGKPKDFSRFLIQANAILTHDTYKKFRNVLIGQYRH